MKVENCKAYKLVDKENLTDLDSVGYLLEHKKTKAKVVLIENSDENKVFNIGFRTPPKDSTGVAHIVEHTVLCGSKEFPVKDPFIELAKGSLNTFLNAMTYPDKTVYPIASCNHKDFRNLMHVYLDAVFYPNIYKEEKIFRQEGWHYELEEAEGELTYNGVVFNEMKGAFSSPDQILYRNIQHSLFPDTAYGVESGGDPVAIPDLTYEDYLEFHRKYYHPSNSYIYLYGDMDMEEQLNWIDENYLQHFDYLEVDSEIKFQKPFAKRKDEYGFYSVTEGEETEGKAYFSFNAVCGDCLDKNLYQAFQVLDHVLVQAVGAPLKQALLDAGIGNDISSDYADSIMQPYFSITAKNVRKEQKQEFLDTIQGTLKKLVKEGLNEKSLKAALNAMEFQYREADFGNFPKGLMYGLQIFDSWLYDAEKPFIHIQANETFAYLRKQIGTDYFENIIQKYLIDNTHTSFVSVEPKVGLTTLMEQEEKNRLAEYKKTLTREQCEKLVQETKDLVAYQEEPTPAEDLKCIPLLTREDIGKKAQPFYNEEKVMAGCPALHHEIFTNGINYLRLTFDVEDLKEYAPYLGLLTEVMGTISTKRFDKLELSNEVLLHAGNFGVTSVVYDCRTDKSTKFRMEVSTKVFYSETEYMIGLIQEILMNSRLDDEKRLKEIIGEIRSSRQASLQANGHHTAISRAFGYFRDSAYYTDQMRGIFYYDFICDLDDNFEERKATLISILQQLAKAIFTLDRLQICLTADAEGYEVLEKGILTLTDGLPKQSEKPMVKPPQALVPPQKNEGFKTASKVQYVARVGSYENKGISYNGIYRVMKTMLSYDYLWNEVRVKGGAYGVMCSFDRDGVGYMVSYRDPNLAQTNDVFQYVPSFLREFKADERDMMKYIIGTVSSLDTPLTPKSKGARSYAAYMSGLTFDEIQKERDEVLAANEESIRQAADMVEALLSDEYICVLGSEEKVKQAEEMFDSVRTLN